MILRKLYLSVLLALLPAGAWAVPVNYTFTLGANDIDADGGTGSLFWDDETHLISQFGWDFGDGRNGSITDIYAGWGLPTFGGTFAEFAFEIVSGNDVHPAACGLGTGCGFSMSSPLLFVGWPDLGSLTALIEFRVNADGTRNYVMWDGEVSHDGSFGAAVPTSVPEPGSFALLAAGLAALTVLRRRRVTAGAGLRR